MNPTAKRELNRAFSTAEELVPFCAIAVPFCVESTAVTLPYATLTFDVPLTAEVSLLSVPAAEVDGAISVVDGII